MVDVVDGAIDVAAVRHSVTHPSFGAILAFEGVGRDHFDGRAVLSLSYEAFLPMAVREMEAIVSECAARWPGCLVSMVHRTGPVAIGEPSVVIAVGAPHRAEAYEASRYALEQLKQRVPIWKKEHYADGSAWKSNAP